MTEPTYKNAWIALCSFMETARSNAMESITAAVNTNNQLKFSVANGCRDLAEGALELMKVLESRIIESEKP